MDINAKIASSATTTNFINHQGETYRRTRTHKRGVPNLNYDFDESGDWGWEDDERPKSKFPIANESELILRKVRAVLNKLTPLNYNRLRKRYANLIPHDTKQLTNVMQFLVTKAMDDPMYLQIYAHLMGYTIGRKSANISQLIRTILNAQIHHELQRLATDMEIAKFNHLVDREDQARRKKVMLHRFIAELFVENVCTTKFLAQRVTDLIGQGKRNFAEADEPLECLCVLLTFAGAKLEETKREWLNQVFLKLNLREAIKSPIISKRIQFMLLDLIEMRSKGWVPHNKWWTPSVSVADITSSCEENEPIAPEFKSMGISKRNYGKKREDTLTLQAILNKVGPKNLEQMAEQCATILQRHEDQLNTALDVILSHVLADTMYIRVHAALLCQIRDAVPLFGRKLQIAMLQLVQENPSSVEIIRFFAELYNVDLIPLKDVISVVLSLVAVPWIESACAFLLGAGKKFEMELKDKEPEGSEGRLMLNSILLTLEQKGEIEGARLHCLTLDTVDLRRNGWMQTRYLRWNPNFVDPTNNKSHHDIESVMKVYEKDAKGGILFIKHTVTPECGFDQFAFNAVLWAIDTGDTKLQKLTGNCVKSMEEEGLLSLRDLYYTVGRIREAVSKMKETKPKAWSDLGMILCEIYSK